MRHLIFAIASLALVAGSSPVFAAPCKGDKGEFTKCPPKVQKPVRCRGANGVIAHGGGAL